MRRLLRKIIYWLSLIIKPKDVLVFSSYPDFSDNPYALFLYLIKHHQYDRYKKVWILEPNPSSEIIEAIHELDPHAIISCSTIKNWYYVIVCRYIFSSHNSYGYLKFRQPNKLFNIWHGMPLKKIGYDNNEVPSYGIESDASMVAASPFFVDCLSSAFRIPKERIFLTGTPRNDLLLEKSDYFEKIVLRKKYKSVGIWMPTFRQSFRDGILNKDTEMTEGAFNYWNIDTLNELNEFLSQTNNYLLLKLHPADVAQTEKKKVYSNIAIIRNEDLPPRELNQLLGETDYLISDYSSVVVDYEVLEKPMGFILVDKDSYIHDRPMYLELTEDNLPGKIIGSMEELKDFIAHYNQNVRSAGTFFNVYKDANNCERLVKALNL